MVNFEPITFVISPATPPVAQRVPFVVCHKDFQQPANSSASLPVSLASPF